MTTDEEHAYDIPEPVVDLFSKLAVELNKFDEYKKIKITSSLEGQDVSPFSIESAAAYYAYSSMNDGDNISEDDSADINSEDLDTASRAFEKLEQSINAFLAKAQSLFKQSIQSSGSWISVEINGEIVQVDQYEGLDQVDALPVEQIQVVRTVLGYQMPKGKIREMNHDHPVLGGWMTQNGWDKLKFDDGVLTEEELKNFKQWQFDKKRGAKAEERSKDDFADFESWIDKQCINSSENLVNTNRHPDQNKSLFIQCFALKMIRVLTIKPSWMSLNDWACGELGLSSINDFYPIATSEGHLYRITSAIWNSHYGPDYFNWLAYKPFRLKGTQVTLYLVSIDIGSLTENETHKVWKIGITKKDVLGTISGKARYTGQIAFAIEILREKIYKDARDAYMIEQTMVALSRKNFFREITHSCPSFNIKQAEITKSIDHNTLNQLGMTEWIFNDMSKEQVIEIYDTMTSYGEFHAEGNISYSVFKREFEKNKKIR
jgi:hypothetical protein